MNSVMASSPGPMACACDHSVLLSLDRLPLGAFAEPQAEELMRAPPRERQRIFAAGPGTNIFASMLLLLLLGFAGHHIVAQDDGVYAQGIVVDSAPQEAGFGPYDVLQSIDGNVILDAASFSDLMQDYTAGQEVILTYLDHETGSEVTASATLGDKHAHYIESGASEEGLVAAGIEPGDAFLGVSGLTSTTQGIDRLVGPMDSSRSHVRERLQAPDTDADPDLGPDRQRRHLHAP